MKKILILILILLLSLPQNIYALTDIDNTHHYYPAISFLSDTNIISGYPDNTYKPDNPINRAELMKILVEAKGITPSEDKYLRCFADIDTEWFAKYVCYAKEQGWIEGYTDNTFRPSQNVNKVEALKMIIETSEFSLPTKVNSITFTDIDSTSWYAPYIQSAQDSDILGESGTIQLHPESIITRGEVSENLYRAIVVKYSNSNSFISPNQTELSLIKQAFKQNRNLSATAINTNAIPLEIQEMLDLINQERAKIGLGHLSLNTKLTLASQNYAQYLIDENYFSHTSKIGVTFDQRIAEVGYISQFLAENIALSSIGDPTASTLDQWMNSEGHKANILEPNFIDIGIGRACSDSGAICKWVTKFGSGDNAF